jgi:Acetyltransferase (GNAT) domain
LTCHHTKECSVGEFDLYRYKQFDHDLEQIWQDLQVHGHLFNSLAWCKAWWQTWATDEKLQLDVIVIKKHDTAVALCPLYFLRERKIFQFGRHYQFIGNIYPSDITILSEYSDLLVKPEFKEALKLAAPRIFKHLNFSKITCAYSYKGAFFLSCVSANNHVERITHPDGASVDTTGSFQDFLSGLGKNTRLKLFNRRSYCEKNYSLKVLHPTDEHEVQRYFEALNTFHLSRWKKPCFNANSLGFHKQVCRHFSDMDQLKFSALMLNNQLASVLYSIQNNGVEYNIQAGYFEHLDKKLSLGTLHIGFALESAFNDKKIKRFDLLMGAGKNLDYKARIATQRTQFETLIIYKNFAYFVFQKLTNIPRRALVKAKHLWKKHVLHR